MNKAIVVIGGGAGGMMAAICAAHKGAHVTLLAVALLSASAKR